MHAAAVLKGQFPSFNFLCLAEPGPARAPADLRRPADDEAGRDEALQDDRPARAPPRGLHHATPEAGRQVPAQGIYCIGIWICSEWTSHQSDSNHEPLFSRF